MWSFINKGVVTKFLFNLCLDFPELGSARVEESFLNRLVNGVHEVGC